jgi:hypothetical protein
MHDGRCRWLSPRSRSTSRGRRSLFCLRVSEVRSGAAKGERHENSDADFPRKHLALFQLRFFASVEVASSGEKGANSRAANFFDIHAFILEYIYGQGIFSRATVFKPHQEYEWLSGTIISCAKA